MGKGEQNSAGAPAPLPGLKVKLSIGKPPRDAASPGAKKKKEKKNKKSKKDKGKRDRKDKDKTVCVVLKYICQHFVWDTLLAFLLRRPLISCMRCVCDLSNTS